MGTAAANSYSSMTDAVLAASNPANGTKGAHLQFFKQAYDAGVKARKVKATEAAVTQRTQQMYATAPAPAQPLATSSGDTSGPVRKESDTEDGATSTRRRAQFRGAGGTSISI